MLIAHSDKLSGDVEIQRRYSEHTKHNRAADFPRSIFLLIWRNSTANMRSDRPRPVTHPDDCPELRKKELCSLDSARVRNELNKVAEMVQPTLG